MGGALKHDKAVRFVQIGNRFFDLMPDGTVLYRRYGKPNPSYNEVPLDQEVFSAKDWNKITSLQPEGVGQEVKSAPPTGLLTEVATMVKGEVAS